MKKAFTLIELLVVIGIIAVLSAILLGTFSGATESARAARCLSNMKSLANACQTAGYPSATSSETVDVDVSGGLANAKKLLDMVKSGEKSYHFIEVMACPGGCVNGGGQPHQSGDVRAFTDLRVERAKALYGEDASMELRKSHENPVVKEIYDSFLEKPGSHKAHKILHTSYVARKVY